MIHRRLNAATAALALVLALGAAGCDGGLFGPEAGNVRFVLSSAPDAALVTNGGALAPSASVVDGPALSGDHDDDDHHDRPNPYFESANVTFTSILARNLEGVLLNIDMDLPATVDVITMEGGREITLPDGDLPPGTYDQVVVVMSQVQGMTHDGTTITIDPPGGGWTAIVPVCPFDVADGETSVIGLQLSVKRSFSWRDGRFRFNPQFVCEPAPEPEPQPEG
jgi:hypothetical protein